MTTVEETVVTITDEQIAAINAARTALKEIANACSIKALGAPTWAHDTPDAADYGRVHALADVAGDSLFTVLAWMNSYYVHKLTEAQLHNRTEDES